MIELSRMRRNEVTEFSRVTDSHNLLVHRNALLAGLLHMNAVFLAGLLRLSVPSVSLSPTFPASISVAVSAALQATICASPVDSIPAFPAPVLGSVFSSESVWSISASSELSRVTAVQNMLFQLSAMIELLAGPINVRMRRMYMTLSPRLPRIIVPPLSSLPVSSRRQAPRVHLRAPACAAYPGIIPPLDFSCTWMCVNSCQHSYSNCIGTYCMIKSFDLILFSGHQEVHTPFSSLLKIAPVPDIS